MPKVKLTVLKVMDQKDIFSESPVKQSKPLPPCEIHKEGQEFIVGPDLNMPERYSCSGATTPGRRSQASASRAAPTGSDL
jgi:uncharacterized repeat protein (TIGR04076 family)